MKNEVLYDLAIIGGGVAGLSLANLMAGKGYFTIVLEKERYPVHRVCGEYLSMEVWDFMQRLGLNLDQVNPPRIKKLKISGPSGNSLTHNLVPGGFGLSRYFLDKALAEIAAGKGAVIKENARVVDIVRERVYYKITTQQGDEIYAKLVCGAYGKRDLLDKKMARAFVEHRPAVNYVGVKYHVAADLPEDQIELNIFDGGYCGISKVEDGDYCLCYLVDARYLKEHKDIQKVEKEVLMKNPRLEKYFGLYPRTVPAVTLSQLVFGVRSPVEADMLYLGDSAGFIAPLTGNGMSIAMRSAFILSKLLHQFFSTGDRCLLETKYREEWERLFMHRIQRSLHLQRLFIDSPSLANFTVGCLRFLPFLLTPLVRMTHGKTF
jgi:menaquinone-9 beta-reductase